MVELLTTTAFVPSLPSSVSPAATVASALSDPFVESELLTDAAHVALDMTSLLGSSMVVLKIAVVVGRLFSIGADWLPDHTILPEELVFQTGMLAAGCVSLASSILPMAKAAAHTSSTPLRDGKMFKLLWKPLGLSWLQSKMLWSQGIVQWREVAAGTVLDSSKMYGLWSGHVDVVSSSEPNRVIHSLERTAGGQASNHLLWANEHLLAHTLKTTTRTTQEPSHLRAATTSRVLEFDTTKLAEALKVDPSMDTPFRHLLLQSMQDKLHLALEAQQRNQQQV